MIRETEQAALPIENQEDTPALNEEEVMAYLRGTPDFFLRFPEILEDVQLPNEGPENVTSMAEFQARRLKERLKRFHQHHQMLMKTSQANMESAEQVQHLALEIVQATDAKKLTAALERTLGKEMGFASVQLFSAKKQSALPQMGAKEIQALFAEDEDVTLRTVYDDTDLAMHGEKAANVKSDALMRLANGRGKTIGLLAIGSGDGTYFHSGQGADLLTFLAGILGACLERTIQK